MSEQKSGVLSVGNVFGLVTGVPKTKNRKEFDAEVARIWPDVVASLVGNPGFKGVMMLNHVGAEEITVIGFWESMEHRLAYEARSATTVRKFFDHLLTESRIRYKQVVAQATWV